MFPQYIIDIILSYQDDDEVSMINAAIDELIYQLNKINESIVERLKLLLHNIDTTEEENRLLHDSQELRKFIPTINMIEYNKKILPNMNSNMEVSKELYSFPILDRKVYFYLITNDICPICNVKLKSNIIHYQKIKNTKASNKDLDGYKCPNCNRLFALDYEIENFTGEYTTEKTNVVIDTKYYNKILYRDIIVICNVNKCAQHNHDLEDLIGDIPVILSNGEIQYISIPIIHCKSCRKYKILKSTYDNLNGIPACIIIDESRSNQSTENEFIFCDKGGSKLYQYGYNVNCIDNLTEQQRQTILAMQLLSNNLTKGEIFSTLDTNINNGNKRKDSKRDWSNAVSKWKSDKEFVENIDLQKENQRININRLILKFNTISKLTN